jgi:aspartokinase/homoserine dehydrogenase 1
MSSAGVNVRFISQSCSEYSLSFAVRSEDADIAEAEISRRVSGTGDYDDVMLLRRSIGIVTVYGDRMKNVAGTSGKVYSALGSEGISVVAAAQGGEELSISIAVDLKDADKAAKILESL